jgi:dTDP-4-amino-4,6-dideoxygalactose transaminase
MYGVFADVKSFQKFGVPIIEDCAQAIDYRGRQEIFGAIAIFSFQPTKCLTTGEGGMAVSNNSDLVNAMRSTRDGQKMAKRGRFFSPLSNISAALGLAQLKRYHQALDRRKVLALGYKHALAKVIPDSLQASALDKSIYLRFPIKISGGVDSYQDLFAKKNICVRRGVDRLLHRLSNLSDDNFQTAVTLYNTTVSLPIYPALTDKEHAYCVESAVEIFAARHS